MSTRSYQTTDGRGLDLDILPMRLFQKAKKFGIWDPRAIDLSRDAGHWQGLSELEQEVILQLTSLFQAGEESVTLDLLPLMLVIAEEGRLEEEMFLASFLWEEAKHVEGFHRFLSEVAMQSGDLSRFQGPSYRQLFHQELPAALNRLRSDSSAIAQAEASVTYNMIVEGVLAETGYHGYYAMLERNQLMPGMQEMIGRLKSDEARHIAYGVFLLSRLVAAGGDEVWQAIEARMSALLPMALGVVSEMFAAYEELPFGLDENEFTTYAMSQFQRRFQRIEKARHQSLEELAAESTADA